jgi:tellurite resistance protein
MTNDLQTKTLYILAAYSYVKEGKEDYSSILRASINSLYSYVFRDSDYQRAWEAMESELERAMQDDPEVKLSDAELMKLSTGRGDAKYACARKLLYKRLSGSNAEEQLNVVRFITDFSFMFNGSQEAAYVRELQKHLGLDVPHDELCFATRRIDYASVADYEYVDALFIVCSLVRLENENAEAAEEATAIKEIVVEYSNLETYLLRKYDMHRRIKAFYEAGESSQELAVKVLSARPKAQQLDILSAAHYIATVDGTLDDSETELLTGVVSSLGLSVVNEYLPAVRLFTISRKLNKDAIRDLHRDKSVFNDDIMALEMMFRRRVGDLWVDSLKKVLKKDDISEGILRDYWEGTAACIHDTTSYLEDKGEDDKVPPGLTFLSWAAQCYRAPLKIRLENLAVLNHVLQMNEQWNVLYIPSGTTIEHLKPYIQLLSEGHEIPAYVAPTANDVKTKGTQSQASEDANTTEATKSTPVKKILSWALYAVIFYGVFKACS